MNSTATAGHSTIGRLLMAVPVIVVVLGFSAGAAQAKPSSPGGQGGTAISDPPPLTKGPYADPGGQVNPDASAAPDSDPPADPTPTTVPTPTTDTDTDDDAPKSTSTGGTPVGGAGSAGSQGTEADPADDATKVADDAVDNGGFPLGWLILAGGLVVAGGAYTVYRRTR